MDELEKAASPEKLISAKEAVEVLSYLNAKITELRAEVLDLELSNDLYLNALLKKEGGGVEMKKSEWRISAPYTKYKRQYGLLADLRALRRNVERRADLLLQQERYNPKSYERAVN